MQPSSTSPPSPYHPHGHLSPNAQPNQWYLMRAHAEGCPIGTRGEANRYQDYHSISPRGGIRHRIIDAPHGSQQQRGSSFLTEGDGRMKQLAPAHYQHTFRERPLASYSPACNCSQCFPEDLRISVIEKSPRERLHSSWNTFGNSHQCSTRNEPRGRLLNVSPLEDSIPGVCTVHSFETKTAQDRRALIPISMVRFPVEPRNLSREGVAVIQGGLPHGDVVMQRSVYGEPRGQTLGHGCFGDCCRTGRDQFTAVRFYEPSHRTTEPAGPSGCTSRRTEHVVRDSNDRNRWVEHETVKDTLPSLRREENTPQHRETAIPFPRREIKPNTPNPLVYLQDNGRPVIGSSKKGQNISYSRTHLPEYMVTGDYASNYNRRPQHSSFNPTEMTKNRYHWHGFSTVPNESTVWQRDATPSGSHRPTLHAQHRISGQQMVEGNAAHKAGIIYSGKASVIHSHSSSLQRPVWHHTIRDSQTSLYEDKLDQDGCREDLMVDPKRRRPSPDEARRRQSTPLENKPPEGVGSEADWRETEEEEDAELPLLQEHLRVLLWALLGSERLEEAASGGGRPVGSGPSRWCQTPVSDLLRAILGACDCADCRRRQHFRALAFEFLNKCPPLAERLAGDPRDLGAVVAAVYHHDLMPSIRRHEADFPEGVRRTVTRVARLELFLQRASQTRRRWPPQVYEERENPVEILPVSKIVKEEHLLLGRKDIIQNTFKEIEFMPKEENKAAKLHSQKANESCSSGYKKIPPTIPSLNNLHPHHQLLLKGIKSSFQHHHNTDSTQKNNDVYIEETKNSGCSFPTNEPKNSAHGTPAGNSQNLVLTDKEQRIKRKRGRPPKYSIDNNNVDKHGPPKRERRTVLWKFLLKLLDGERKSNERDNIYSNQRLNDDHRDCCLHSHHQQIKQGESKLKADTENLTEETMQTFKLEKHPAHNKSRGSEHTASTTSKLNLASSSPNSPCMRWICRHDGLFQIIDSTKLAILWGLSNKNPNMTYEKLSRALRTYYHQNILIPVPRSYNLPKKLVYKFNPELLKV
ncbi:uncharacterized protein LOC124161193 isoform X2 [Ischnura elegans]|uniref:uncharacterized protein LOC124161193 isoform X2 n=1 Tax=Ischnura elegans TaxID=197161 RepID=UPI001ED873F7|nr:uncharacterized protein LOC124161193 isoform X2 [Ischnura elegans]